MFEVGRPIARLGRHRVSAGIASRPASRLGRRRVSAGGGINHGFDWEEKRDERVGGMKELVTIRKVMALPKRAHDLKMEEGDGRLKCAI